MTERSSDDIRERIAVFDRNYPLILEKIAKAAEVSGRRAEDIILLAATKTVPPDTINHAVEHGIKFIGENRVQELIAKYNDITQSVHRHFIGHLQTNKVKDVVGRVEMIESVDSVRLAQAIGDRCAAVGKVMDILLEINIGNEESKSGFKPAEITAAVAEIAKIQGVCVKGLMAIPPICDKKSDSAEFFCQMRKLFIDIGAKNIDNVNMVYLSMGMSDDFEPAIECGANIVRIGSALFGRRILSETNLGPSEAKTQKILSDF